jgi:hypothetical protein
MIIKICPLKKLLQILEKHSVGIAAVISTSGELPDRKALRGIPYICRQYRDIDFDGPGAFSPSDAACFAEFLQSLGPETDVLYCCCDAAMSRSPAVAGAAGRYLGLDMMDAVWRNPSYRPNLYVFELLCQALGVPVRDEELDLLLYESNQAFKKTIAQARKS